MRYFTSDTHYGHENIIRFCGRPYADAHHMNVDLVNRAAAVVEPGDELWHLGDAALGYLDSSLTNLARVPGQVTLVAGNRVNVQISHFPYGKAENVGDKFARWRAIDDGSWLRCGHVHER